MILGYTKEEIVKAAIKSQGNITDGVAAYDYTTGKLHSCAYTTGETEHPDNHLIEIFRLSQGESGEFDYDCHECPYRYKDAQYEGWEELYPATREECCQEVYIDDDFYDDFESNSKEFVEIQIKDVLSDYIGETLSKLDEIRIKISDIIAPYDYLNVRQDNWDMDVMDFYVDNALENGLNITKCTPIEYLDAEVTWIASVKEENRSETLNKVGSLVEDGDLDGALKLLQ